MTDQSRYLRYLPPVLQTEAKASELPLGKLLLMFERILTGVADDTPPGQPDVPAQAALEQVIADLHRLFDPWHVRPDFLPWLASWLELEFPTLQDQPLWDVYQQRRAVADMASVYQQRGLKAGLKHSLYLHTLGDGRPRIAIDDGSRLLTCRPQPGSYAPVHTLVSCGAWQQVSPQKAGLFRPRCLAFLPDGTLIVGDVGLDVEAGKREDIAPGLWRIAAGGDGAANQIGTNMQDLVPISICLGPDNGTLYVLSRPKAGGDVTLRYLTGDYSSGNEISLPNPSTQAPLDRLVRPLAMVAKQVSSAPHLYILDRGVDAGTSKPKILDVAVSSSPVTIKGNSIDVKDVEPLSLAVLNNDDFIIGAGGLQDRPGILIRVTTGWTVTTIVPTDGTQNPLVMVTPTALVPTGSDYVYVLDTGLRVPDGRKPFQCDVARDAAIYSVNLVTGTIAQASEAGQLINPVGMAMKAGTLFIAEPGIVPLDAYQALWRARRHEFAVTVHFRKTLEGDPRLARILRDIRTIVDREKPAHTVGRVFSVIRGDF